jgi:hypothetical protein
MFGGGSPPPPPETPKPLAPPPTPNPSPRAVSLPGRSQIKRGAARGYSSSATKGKRRLTINRPASGGSSGGYSGVGM